MAVAGSAFAQTAAPPTTDPAVLTPERVFANPSLGGPVAQGVSLSPDGALMVEVGTGRDIVEQEFPQLPFLWLDTAQSEAEVFVLAASALCASGSR